MTGSSACACGGSRSANGNCSVADDGGLSLQCVGAWAQDKHDYLRRYIGATRAVRARYLPPEGTGGAAFIDLFAGPGRARVRSNGDLIEGSPFLALEHESAPFTRVVLCELDAGNVAALRARTAGYGERVRIVAGDCNDNLTDIVRLVPAYGLNVALVDPFGAKALHWSTLERLGRFRRMDFLVHFPTMAIRRNLKKTPGYADLIDRMMGTDEWRAEVNGERDIHRLVDCLLRQLQTLGYEGDQSKAMPIRTGDNKLLYHLVFASKHDRGSKIWESVTRIEAGGQRGLDFG